MLPGCRFVVTKEALERFSTLIFFWQAIPGADDRAEALAALYETMRPFVERRPAPPKGPARVLRLAAPPRH